MSNEDNAEAMAAIRAAAIAAYSAAMNAAAIAHLESAPRAVESAIKSADAAYHTLHVIDLANQQANKEANQ